MNKVSLFSGAGGLDLGFESVGFCSRFCTDIDPYSCRTLAARAASKGRNRFPFLAHAHVRCSDVNDLRAEDILSDSRLKPGEVDVLVGGPPCQSFSVFGKRGGLEDPRGRLVWQYVRLLKGLRPEAFVFENVPGLLSIDSGRVFSRFLDDVHDVGYSVDVFVLEAADFGVPQFRKRVFVIGNRASVHLPPINARYFDPRGLQVGSGARAWNNVADAFRNLPALGGLPNHTGRNHSDRIVARYQSLKPGERDHFTRINRLDATRPSFTIIVGSDKGGGKGHVHPTEPREVTPRESARIQTFPDWWEFTGTSRHPIRQIGNAVPPVLASAVASHLLSHIFRVKPIAECEIHRRLGQTHLGNPAYRPDYEFEVGIPSITVREPDEQEIWSAEDTQIMATP